MPDKLWLADNRAGVGRIRREAWQLHIGDVLLDVTWLRNHFVSDMLEPALTKLTPRVTALECLWISQVFNGYLPWTDNKVMEMLLKLCRGT